MDEGTHGDPEQQIGPDPSEDVADLTARVRESVRELQPGGGVRAGRHIRLEHERLDVALKAHPSEHGAGEDRDAQPGDDVERGDTEAEHAEQQHDRDLVDQRRGDQERQRHTERHAR